MGSVGLELRPTTSFVPQTISDFLFDLSTIPTTSDKLDSLQDFLSRLQRELTKIHAFKRELPLSILLLNDAILVLNEESEKCRRRVHNSSVPVLEEFIPLKKENNNDHHHHQTEETDTNNNNNNSECRDKKNWMSSVQLWNNTTTTTTTTINHNNNVVASDTKQHHNKLQKTKRSEEEEQSVTEEPFQSCSNRNGGSAFIPFSTHPSVLPVTITTVPLQSTKEEKKEDTALNRLTLLTPGVKTFREGFGLRGPTTSSNGPVSSPPPPPSLRSGGPLQPQQQTSRKQRRCWSPELHRRFVNALQKLGGSQAATPKQIRELMQVDGLTNDEVKSHLQKYRLHTRRVPASSTNQSVVVLGGLWMSQEQYNDSSKGSSSGSGSPQSPLHLATGSRGGTSPTEGDDSMEEDDEDEKCESYSWKSQIHRPGKVDV